MTKDEALKRIKELEAYVEGLDKPVRDVFVPKDDGKGYFMPYLPIYGGASYRGGANLACPVPAAAFRDAKSATAFAEAMQTMMLAQLHGGWHLRQTRHSGFICVRPRHSAIEAVGKDRIIKAVKTLVGVRDD